MPLLAARDVPQLPMGLGQAAQGAFTSTMTPPRSMQRVQRLDEMGALIPKPSIWENIARGIGMASPQGRAILQYGDQQQQQLQNRLAARRQALSEEQSERAEIRDDFNSLITLSNVKNKALRNMYADRLFAGMAQRGKEVPPDFIEAYKKSGLEEGKQMATFYEPLLKDLDMDPAAFAELVTNGDIKDLTGMLDLAYKLKKQKADEAAATGARQQAQQLLGTGTETLGDVSGLTAPSAPGAPGAPTPPPAQAARQPAAAPSKDYTDAIDEASRLYPQVRKELIPAMIARESNWDAKAVSPKGAQGPMQLMPGTAKEMGVDDPFDTRQNVRGGTRYYAQQLTRYKGNEALALAAYNWGPKNVDDVGGDFSKMPKETQRYVAAVLQRASGGGHTGSPAS